MEGIPWTAFSAGSAGWLLSFALLYGYGSGRWSVPRREADVYLKRAETAEANVERLTQQNSELLAWAQIGKNMFAALNERVEGKP